MKNIIVLLGFMILLLSKSFGQDTIHACGWMNPPFPIMDMNNRDTVNKYVYFDTTQTNNIWQLGTPSKIIFDTAYSRPLALVTDSLFSYPNNNISSFKIIVNSMSCNSGGIYFWHRFNTDTLSDGCVIEYSSDGGITWNNIINSTFTLYNFYSTTDSISSNSNKPGFSGTTEWTHSNFTWIYPSTIMEYRFTFTSDSINSNKDGWMIDDLEVQNYYFNGISEVNPNTSIQVMPNPTSDFISIRADNSTKLKSVTITDIVGKEILITDKTTIDLSQLEIGIYFVIITTETGRFVSRVLRK